ncbi:MAG TPA: cyclic nucleotide-binding domain-containing protein [Kofleriaceae bacterium]|nr:cyclic nucleotide-binding domain-containing protein [Kofleriaceae bacterium]
MGPSASDLRAIPLFRGFDDAALAAIGALFTRIIVDDSVPLFDVGEPATTLYLLSAGEVVLERPDDDTFKLAPPALIGELGALATLPRSTRAMVAPGSTVWGLSAQKLQGYFADHQDLGVQFLANLLGVVADKVHRDQRRMAGMRQNLMRTQKELKRLREVVLESVDTPLSAAVHDSLDRMIAHNRRVNYRVEPPPVLPAHARLDSLDGAIASISRSDMTLRQAKPSAKPSAKIDQWCSGVLDLAGTEIPISGTVTRIADDQVTVTFDLLIDEYAAILEQYLTRAQLLDVLV